ncbi:hypothetical protein K2M58_06330 [Hydrogenibacillus sp. N12]|nr:hypothetical protein K2M58_06330 [Hydrogenibacillus sp. N12]
MKRIGIVYNPGEQNSVAQIKAIQAEIERHGYPLQVVEAAVANTSEVKQVAESLIGRIDAFYVITHYGQYRRFGTGRVGRGRRGAEDSRLHRRYRVFKTRWICRLRR